MASDVNIYRLWTTEDVHRWLCSLNELSDIDNKKLLQKLIQCGVNGYNITKYKKKDIMKRWGIKKKKHRNFIFDEIQKLTQIPIQFKSWTTGNVAKYITFVFQNTKSADFTSKLENEIIEQEINGTELTDIREDDIECLLDEDDYKDDVECEKDIQKIFEAIKTINQSNSFSATTNTLITPHTGTYCEHKETLVDDCLVVFFGIKQYKSEIFHEYGDLNVDEDRKYLKNAFQNQYGYTFFSNNIEKPWYLGDVQDFFQTVRNKYLWSSSPKSVIHHNGLIICIAGHGSDHHIICSDGDKLPLKHIRAQFSDVVHSDFKHLPKVFIVNCCRDDNEETRGTENIIKPSIYSVTLLPTSESNKAFGATFSQNVAKSFLEHKDNNTTLHNIYKTIKQIHGDMILNEHDVNIDDVKFCFNKQQPMLKHNSEQHLSEQKHDEEEKYDEEKEDSKINDMPPLILSDNKITPRVRRQSSFRSPRQIAFEQMKNVYGHLDWKKLYKYIEAYGKSRNIKPSERDVKDFFKTMQPNDDKVTFKGFAHVVKESGDVVGAFKDFMDDK
eukprot:81186_1